jgi:hypothetical protein
LQSEALLQSSHWSPEPNDTHCMFSHVFPLLLQFVQAVPFFPHFELLEPE